MGAYGVLAAGAIILAFLAFIFAIAAYVVGSFFMMKIFEKAGVQGKWRAWVPVYNTMILGKLGDLSPWIMLGGIVVAAVLGQIDYIGFLFSLVAVAIAVAASWRVGLKFGQEWYLLLLWLIPGLGTLIWLGILAFGNKTWNPNIAPAPWANVAWLRDSTVWDGIPVQPQAAAAGPAAPPAAPAPAQDDEGPAAPTA